MGRICAWCGTVLRGTATFGGAVNHGLCNGCLEDLLAALASTGMVPKDSRLQRGSG